MLITGFSFQNLYSFEDFTVDLTYPRPLKFTTIEHEYLSFAPRFKVKRVCIISGGNATGKTSLGKLLCAATNFIAGRNNGMSYIKVRDPKVDATLRLEFLIPRNRTFHEAILGFRLSENQIDKELGTELIRIEHRVINIRESDTPIIARNRLAKADCNFESLEKSPEINLTKYLNNKIWPEGGDISINQLLWKYIFYETSEPTDKRLADLEFVDLDIASKILKAFDPTILGIKELVAREEQNKSNEAPKTQAYKIEFSNGNHITLDSGKFTNPDGYKRLSKGTFEALSIIDFIETIIHFKKHDASATLFLDERMAHVHTQLETAMLNVMIQKLGKTSQLFYTTHNADLLEMEIPIHSHLFLKRNDNFLVEAVQPETVFKKNDRKVSQYVKNDIFGTCPDTSLIDEIVYAE
ncbi:hypothetical protein [uncultured Thiothrix sp.]|uniref:hypothetical protein n=1 Tax=uncultured Thiothrix sp. TaxID=223185 RepID=UPI002601C9AC|nr:hypothetical protein [uncultured Thiothrix sp.]